MRCKAFVVLAFGIPLLATGAFAQSARMFVTSVSGSPDLSTWADAGGFSGADAGDAICQARAAAAGLSGDFRAWLSDSNDDAYCRIRGFAGTKASNCNGELFIFERGPWLLTTGAPFGETLSQILQPNFRTYHPPRHDELGARLPPGIVPARIWTGTSIDGTYSGHSCDDWTSTSTSHTADLGDTEATGDAWSYQWGVFCNVTVPFRLACFQNLAFASALPPFGADGRLAFVSSEIGNANLGSWSSANGFSGIDAGDAICQTEAANAELKNASSFKAWLSTEDLDARDRFDFDGPWVRVDGILLAGNLADLTDGELRTSLNVSAGGDYLVTGNVWTGTTANGEAGFGTCSDWTSAATNENTTQGDEMYADDRWTDRAGAACSTNGKLYCLSDLDIGYIFGDGFESGNTSAWSATN